jgi:hypothetical protein
MAEWHYVALDGAAEGPVSVDELKALYSAKHISFETNVWCAGREGWCEINDEPQLKAALRCVRRPRCDAPKPRANTRRRFITSAPPAQAR